MLFRVSIKVKNVMIILVAAVFQGGYQKLLSQLLYLNCLLYLCRVTLHQEFQVSYRLKCYLSNLIFERNLQCLLHLNQCFYKLLGMNIKIL